MKATTSIRYARAAAGRVGIDRFQEKHWADLERRVRAARAKEVKQIQQQPPQRRDGTPAARNRVRFRMEV